jgi:hypothetical protein
VLLDNCEHLVETVAHLTDRLLRARRTPGSWPPAASRSGCPARSPGPSPAWPPPTRRCRPTSWAASTPSACLPSGPPPPGPGSAWTSRPARWPLRSVAGWTACRWPSSWPPPGPGPCRSRRSPAGWTTASAC